MLTELLPHCSNVVFCACSNHRALSPATLGSLASQLSGPPAEIEPDPRRALAGRAGRHARRRGAGHRLDLPDRRPPAPARRAQGIDAVSDDGPSVPAMIAAVAIIVALVILVFFAIGYGFGRLFL